MNQMLNRPEILFDFGQGHPEIVFTVGMHGNEPQPIVAVNQFFSNFPVNNEITGRIRVIKANPLAVQAGRRFISQDLNRSFPGVKNAAAESGLATEILKSITGADYVIDLHTAASGPAFIILGTANRARLELAEQLPIQPIVLFESSQPSAMVDFTACGIGVELGQHHQPDSLTTGLSCIKQLLTNLKFINGRSDSATEHDYFQVERSLTVDQIPKELIDKIGNFQPVKNSDLGITSQTDLSYPILYGRKDYSSIYCYLSRRIKREDIIKSDD